MDDHKSIYIKNAVWLAVLTLLEVGVAFLSISRSSSSSGSSW